MTTTFAIKMHINGDPAAVAKKLKTLFRQIDVAASMLKKGKPLSPSVNVASDYIEAAGAALATIDKIELLQIIHPEYKVDWLVGNHSLGLQAELYSADAPVTVFCKAIQKMWPEIYRIDWVSQEQVCLMDLLLMEAPIKEWNMGPVKECQERIEKIKEAVEDSLKGMDDVHGIIYKPEKDNIFLNQAYYIPYYWDMYKRGIFDHDDNGVASIIASDEEIEVFGFGRKAITIILIEHTVDGQFICGYPKGHKAEAASHE